MLHVYNLLLPFKDLDMSLNIPGKNAILYLISFLKFQSSLFVKLRFLLKKACFNDNNQLAGRNSLSQNQNRHCFL